MSTAKSGDTVKVHYTGKLADGTVFDSSAGGAPLEFKLGEGQVIQGFDTAVVGMDVGASKTETIPSDRAYGDQRPDLLFEVERERVPSEGELEVGMGFAMSASDGNTIPVRVAKLSDDTVTLDANHPLAGKDLTFEIELVEIVG